MPENNFNDEKFSSFPLDDDPVMQPEAQAKPAASRVANKSLANAVKRSVEANAKSKTKQTDDALESRDFRPIRQRRDSRTGLLGGFMYFIFVLSVSIILAILGWMAASDVLALNKEELVTDVVLEESFFTPEQITVENEDGTTTTKTILVADMGDVATALKNAGIIDYKPLFKFYAMISNTDTKLDPGTYTLSTELDYRAIVKKMQFGSDSQVRTTVTFPEGFTMKEIFNRLEENKICKYDDLMESAANHEFSYKFLEGIPLGDASRLEGFLFPDTYEFYQGMTPEAAIDTFLQIFHYKLTAEMWDLAAARGYSMRDVVNMASLIEKEAANDEERPIIAGIIYNRLKANMSLGIDAAIQYTYEEHKDVLTGADFEVDTPYNLRMYKGFPPTPICSPGFASIMAVLKPTDNNYYYYALDVAAGTHRFFTDSNSFNAFVKTQNYGQ